MAECILLGFVVLVWIVWGVLCVLGDGCRQREVAANVEMLMAENSGSREEISRIRSALLDAQCRLEIIDDGVGFWVDDKMQLRWRLDANTSCCCPSSSGFVSEGADDCA